MQSEMIGWFKSLFISRPMLDLEPACGRIASAQVRLYSPTDFDGCCELYRLNEPDRFPAGHLPSYEAALHSNLTLFLVVEEHEQIVATAGVSIVHSPQMDYASLCFGLVHPSRQKQGLGTTLLLARLALLPDEVVGIGLSAVPKSRGFYERFGFRNWLNAQPDKNSAPVFLYIGVSPDILDRCRALLDHADVILPRNRVVVPTKEITK